MGACARRSIHLLAVTPKTLRQRGSVVIPVTYGACRLGDPDVDSSQRHIRLQHVGTPGLYELDSIHPTCHTSRKSPLGSPTSYHPDAESQQGWLVATGL